MGAHRSGNACRGRRRVVSEPLAVRGIEQLELNVDEDDGLSWGEWFRSLPVTPGSETTVGERFDALKGASRVGA